MTIEINEVVKKLIGPIDPVGAAHIDGDRLDNLKKAIALTEELIDGISCVYRENIDRTEWSMAEAGKTAQLFLKEYVING